MVKRVESGGPAGCIINLSSINAKLAIPTQVPYTISKGGVRQLTNVFAQSLASYGIRVNAIGPGSIDTRMFIFRKLESRGDAPCNAAHSDGSLRRVG